MGKGAERIFSALVGMEILNGDQFVGILAQADLLCVLDLCPPCGVGEVAGQVIQVGPVGLGQLGIRHHRLGIDGFGAGQIQCHGIEGGKHTHIGNDGMSFSAWQSQ